MTDAPRAPRLLALDAFRGATIAGMILVNNPGSWSHVYAPLLHAEWHGWTPTDLVFPFFLWIVGVAITLSLGRRLEAGAPKAPLVRKIMIRALVLIALGIFLASLGRVLPALFGFGERTLAEAVATWRWPGVLQRIGVCYALTALAYLYLPRCALPWLCAALLFGYQAVMTLVPVPGLGAPDIDTPGGHLSAWLDIAVFGEGHVWQSAKVYDPEGLLSTLPAIGTCLLGLFAGQIVRAEEPLERRVLRLFVTGSLLVVAGYVWDWWFPINKKIWTSSYATFTAGQAACGLALFLYACDVKGWRRWAEPLRVYGVNPITVFVGSAILVHVTLWITVTGGDGQPVALRTWFYRDVFAAWLAPKPASLAFALTWIAAWGVILKLMDRAGIHLRV